ncbi:hypothetical protein HW445_30190, partial [Streptomyces sp. UH6]|nr:hypothetical protein [Streptomyces sp. UH6]
MTGAAYRTATFRVIPVQPEARELMPGVRVLTLEAEVAAGGAAPADDVWAQAHARWTGA